MADITINDLLSNGAAGNDLFSDTESFMMELSDDDQDVVGGVGETPMIHTTPLLTTIHCTRNRSCDYSDMC
jgi:hypothetical protein